MLVGDFTEWQQGALVMEKGNDGVWTTTVKLPPGKHSYLFIVDGQWCEDPECSRARAESIRRPRHGP